ncbi:MAG: hypothetical protein Q8R15_00745 [Candidatus Micrarchaeota archaeon]|nr:hypothetical protein [Candidatus Micrarchaeota archaeon]
MIPDLEQRLVIVQNKKIILKNHLKGLEVEEKILQLKLFHARHEEREGRFKWSW